MIEMSKKKKNSTISLIAIAAMAAAVLLIAATTLIPTQVLAGGYNDDPSPKLQKLLSAQVLLPQSPQLLLQRQ
jgi:hypothetical protein